MELPGGDMDDMKDRLTDAEVEALLRETKLDEQMKAWGQWEDWTSGRRGRNKAPADAKPPSAPR